MFVEKPMALTRDECRDARGRGPRRPAGSSPWDSIAGYAPYYVQMKQRLRGRTTPVVINCRVNSPGISGAYWMADPAIGGAILGEACHFVDLMYWMLESEPVAVSAFTLPTGRPHPVGENNLVASFQFADGSIGNLTYCTVGSRTSGGERVEVFGEGFGAATEDFTRLDVRGNVRRHAVEVVAGQRLCRAGRLVRAGGARGHGASQSACATALAQRSDASRCSSRRARRLHAASPWRARWNG